jgi:hypothetical protein
MSALGASLAKGWITQYATPVTGKHWDDAFLRHRRFIGIKRWHLNVIIQCLPILIHIAFFLFAIGLVILLFQNDIAIGGVIICLVFIITVLYLGSTVHPVYSLDSPFRTPVTSFITWIFGGSGATSDVLELLDDDACKAQALGWLLKESADITVIEATIQAIAGLPLQPVIQHVLYHSQIVNLLSRGLSESVQTSGNSNLLRAYLYAILHLVQAGPLESDDGFTPAALVSLISIGGPLHQLHDLEHSVQGIALCVKGRIQLLFPSSSFENTIFHTDIPIMLKSSEGHLRLLLQEVYLLANYIPNKMENSADSLYKPTILELLKSTSSKMQKDGYQKLSDKVNNGMSLFEICHGQLIVSHSCFNLWG